MYIKKQLRIRKNKYKKIDIRFLVEALYPYPFIQNK